jgi:hypothetical protein
VRRGPATRTSASVSAGMPKISGVLPWSDHRVIHCMSPYSQGAISDAVNYQILTT